MVRMNLEKRKLFLCFVRFFLDFAELFLEKKKIKLYMRKIILILMCFLPAMLSAQGLRAIYSFTTYSSEQGNYVDLNTSIDLQSLISTTAGSQVEITTLICDVQKTDSVFYVDKRILEVKAEEALKQNQMLDIQRIKLQNGVYLLYMSFRDLNSSQAAVEIKDAIKVDYKVGELALSDVQIINEPKKSDAKTLNVKHGYEMIPYSFDALPKGKNRLDYYVEVYNADKYFALDSLYLLTASIEDISTNRKVENFIRAERVKAKPVSVHIGALDITELPEGSYYLTLEVRDAKNILHAYKREPFYRQSDKKQNINSDIPRDAFVLGLTDEQLDENIKTLEPIASEAVKEFIRKDLPTATKEVKQFFLYNFWRSEDPTSPQTAWQEYRTRLEYVNRTYTTNIKEGYLTDMGRVYLVYGPPSYVIDEKFKASSGLKKRTLNDIAATPGMEKRSADGVNYLPYQMWRYDRTPFGESNRMFVFYAKQNDISEYTLLHSNARGEINEIYWEDVLSRYTLGPGIEGEAGVQFRKGHK